MNHDRADNENKPVPPGPEAGDAAANPLIRRFQVSMPADEMAREIDRLAGETSHKIKMPGFRQGKVPVDVVKKVHQQSLREEIIQQTVGKLAFAHIERERLAIAGEPYVEKLDDRGSGGFQADIAVEILPEVELPDWSQLQVEIPAAALKGEVFDEAQQIDRVLEANKRSLPVQERAVATGDLVLLTVQSIETASKRKWPRQETYFMMNAENTAEIAGLFAALLGKKPAETLSLKATYPADAAKKAWAGKEIEHQVEIKAVYEMKKPELDEEFLKSLGLKNADEFKARLQEEFRHHQEHRRQEAVMEGIFEALLAKCRFPVPRSLQEQEAARRLSENRQPLRFKDDEEKAKFKEMLFAQAEKTVRLSLILDKVREKFQVTVEAAELEKEYARLAQHHQVSEKEIRQYYGEEKKAAELKDHLLQGKVNEFLREKIQVKEV